MSPEVIAAVLLHDPRGLCVKCIAIRTDMSADRVEDMLCSLKRECPVVVIHGRCARCLQERDIVCRT